MLAVLLIDGHDTKAATVATLRLGLCLHVGPQVGVVFREIRQIFLRGLPLQKRRAPGRQAQLLGQQIVGALHQKGLRPAEHLEGVKSHADT
jgi:hypothetical protein